MGEAKYFVLVITDLGLWLATCAQSDYDRWANSSCKLKIKNVRGYNIVPDHQTKQVRVEIGNAYPVDIDQAQITVDATAVEIIGDILENESGEYCTTNSSLFNAYKNNIMNWKAARSNITIADPSMMSKIQNLPSNVKPFPKR